MKFFFFLLVFIPMMSMSQPDIVPSPKREFRGVWIATVSNIDWPSRAGLSVDQQKQELIGILERHKAEGMNAVMLQVRPAADAIYSKSREPWSQWLMGKQGQSPAKGYDPLAFAIEEAHFRGMELHAWFNPYRASVSKNSILSLDHITRQHPEWFFTYAGQKQFDPGLPEVRAYIVQVVLDVVKHYDIDGVHLDDYFYPYPVSGQKLTDEITFHNYHNNYTDIKDWRRNNVDLLVKMLNDSVHYYKNYLKFGISPRAIWKNKSNDSEGSETNGGEAFYENYADTRKWAREKWLDYINPQIYFTFARKAAPFQKLATWWINNSYERHLYVGLSAYLVNSKNEAAWSVLSEIPNQIRLLRESSGAQGIVFFSSNSLRNVARSISDSLKTDLFKYPALPPLMPWLDDVPPNPPRSLAVNVVKEGVQLIWEKPLPAKDKEVSSGFVIYRFKEGEEISLISSKNIYKILFKNYFSFIDTEAEQGKRYSYVVTALDRLKNESEMSGPVGIEVIEAK